MSQPSSPGDIKPNSSPSCPSSSTLDVSSLNDTRGFGSDAGRASTIDFAPQAVIGPYQILKKLGQGGMGAVYQARHIKLDKLVALKVLSPHLVGDTEAVQRFEREMKAVGKLDHPNIVRAMDAGQIGETHYLVMEYVHGTDLQRLVKADGPRPIGDACRLIRQAAMALAHAHAHGLVHRDLKPSNLFLTSEGQLKILDLGLARLGSNSDSLTSTGASLGTPDYMAPEQWTDMRLVDHRSDLYALGCTLYFLLIGRPPFGDEQHGSAASKMAGHISGAIPSLSAALPGVPTELAALYQSLLAKQRDDRPASALELAESLTPFADSEPSWSSAPRPQPSTRPRVSKKPAWTALIGSGVLVVGAIAAFGVYLANSARNSTTVLPDKSQAARPSEQTLETPNDQQEKVQPEEIRPEEVQPGDDPTAIPPSPPISSDEVPEASIMDDDLPQRPREKTRPRAEERHAANAITVKLDETSGSIRRGEKIAAPAVAELVGHSGPIRCATFSASGRYLATGSDDQTLRVWDLKLGAPVACLRGYPASVRCVAFSANEELVAWSGAGYFTMPVLVWSIKAKKQAASFEFTEETSPSQVNGLAFSSNGKLLAAAGSGPVHVWDLDQLRLVHTLTWQKVFPSYAYGVAFSPDGSLLAAGCHGGEGIETPESVRTWQLPSGEEADRFSGDSHSMGLSHDDIRGTIAFSADGTRLFRLTKGDDHFGRMRAGKGRRPDEFGPFGKDQEKGSLLSWSLEDRRPAPQEVPTGGMFGLALLPNDRLLVAAAGASERFGRLGGLPGDLPRPPGQCELWEGPADRTIPLDTGHQQGITALGLSRDGAFLATGGDDNLVKLWDLKQILAK